MSSTQSLHLSADHLYLQLVLLFVGVTVDSLCDATHPPHGHFA